MFGIAYARRGAIALMLAGIAFFIIGVGRHRNGGSDAFILIGVVFLMIGLRQPRRVAPDPSR